MELIDVDKKFIKKMDKYRVPDKKKGLLENCSKNPVIFSERMLGIKLRSWQVFSIMRILKGIENRLKGKQNTEREFILLTSRQVGKSTLLAILSIWCCVFNKVPGTTSNATFFGIVSASDVQAKKLLYEIKRLMRLGNLHMKNTYKDDEGRPLFGKEFFEDLLDDKEPNNTTTVTFKPYDNVSHGELLLKDSKAGSMIKSYPPTSSVLGETFSVVVIDEAGKTDKISDQFFYDFMYPTGNSTDAIRIYTSTPWVSSGFFYRLVNPDNMYKDTPTEVYVFTIDAIKLEDKRYYDTVMKIVKQLNEDGKIDEVQRAYYCRFVKGQKSYFAPDKVISAFHTYDMYDMFTEPCDMGVDFGGQVKSKTVITISYLDEDGGAVKRIFCKSYKVGEDETLIEDIEQLMDRFNIQRVVPDYCPAGWVWIKKMQDKGWNVQPMEFRKDKVKKYGAFRSMLNRGQIMSFMDEDLKVEMLAMENSEGSRQSVIQAAPGYNDDRIDSFVMSAYFFLNDDTGLKMFDWDAD